MNDPQQRSSSWSRNGPLIALAVGAGCLLVVPIVGIVSAILIPNLLDALQRAKQKRTVVDMRRVGNAWMAWAADHAAGTAGESGLAEGGSYDFGSLEVELSPAELADRLVPSYLPELPAQDGWGHPFELRATTDGAVLAMRSPGRDGLYEGSRYTVAPFALDDYDGDLVWAEGFFIRWPSAPERGAGGG